MTRTLRIATRKSQLALWQANHVRSLLQDRDPGLDIELVPIVTQGDRIVDRPLATIGGKGLFLKELEQALLANTADLAVHSMKDVPAENTPGLVLASVLERANPFDAWVGRSGPALRELPEGSVVGTSSLRRQCLLRALRPDLRVEDLRGNVDTRLRRLDECAYDAIILACAGLERLGLADRIDEVLEPPEWLPAPTQGIIALQCRTDDDELRALLSPLGSPVSDVQARAERAVARVLQGSCQVPLAAYAELDGKEMTVQGLIGSPDGVRILRARKTGSVEDPEALGERVAQSLLEQGAAEIIAQLNA